MNTQPKTPPSLIVIFGITGDLAQRKLLPALYHLFKDNLLDPQTLIVGITRREVTKKQLLGNVELCINEIDKKCDPQAIQKMHNSLHMYKMDLVQPDDYKSLRKFLDSLEEKQKVCMNRLYYLSIPSQVFGPIVRLLGEHGLNESCQHGIASTRLLIEKPFGYDQSSGRLLIEETGRQFNEDQIFRIDHYLAKETVQNILMFRFSNPLFMPVWNHEHVESIHINAKEKLGIENRVIFYEQTGALRDLIQSHLLQLLGLVTMELPKSLESMAIHKNKQILLGQVQPPHPDEINKVALRGQYDTYKKQINNPSSITETFASLELRINNPRWQDVPIKLTTGKALSTKRTDITLMFKADDNGERNSLTFRIQPAEGIELRLKVKKPGFEKKSETVLMDFSYKEAFSDYQHPDAYERVLVDAVRGDHTLFATADEVMAGWRIVQPVIDAWAKNGNDIITYATGSDGPERIKQHALKQ